MKANTMARIIQTENGQLTRQFFISQESTSIGRSKSNTIQLDDKIVCSKHAEIFTEHDHLGNNVYFLMDLYSKSGSFINENKVVCKQLKHKDLVCFGQQNFIFIDEKDH
jgi:pSer/pThr/pTyr-binding forkhead associated (FHA) protein